jgi:hypothetical protein
MQQASVSPGHCIINSLSAYAYAPHLPIQATLAKSILAAAAKRAHITSSPLSDANRQGDQSSAALEEHLAWLTLLTR